MDYGRKGKFCHMVSSTSIAELHEFAQRIGVKRCWYHKGHYDLRPYQREAAFAAGAFEVTARELVSRMCGRAGMAHRERQKCVCGQGRYCPKHKLRPEDGH